MNSMLKFKQSLSVRKFPRGSQRFPEVPREYTEAHRDETIYSRGEKGNRVRHW